MAQAARNLKLVDEHGEIHDSCPECQKREDIINGLQRDIRGWAARYKNLQRDKEEEAKEDPAYPLVLELFAFWQLKTNHPRSKWGHDRFERAKPMLAQYGMAICERAVEGAAFDCFKTKMRNGAEKRHDDFNFIFRDSEHVENLANRAPRK